MYLLETITGFIAGIIMITATILAYKVHKNFEANEQLAATKISLKNSITKSLTIQVIGTVIFGITGLISLLAIVNNWNGLSNLYRLGTVIVFTTYLYMIYNIQQATKTRSNKNEPGSGESNTDPDENED